MPSESLKATAITNIDANPPVRATAGKGGASRLHEVSGFVSPTTGPTTGSIYRMVRVPSNAVIKRLTLESHGTITTLTCGVGVYYSDAAVDETGSSQGNTGVVNSKSTIFASALAMATPDVPNDVTNQAGTYDVSLRNKELWDACGLSTDPGGFFDIVVTTSATNSLTNGAVLGLRCEYASPQVG